MKFYIVWNEGRNEGFITDNLADAKQTRKGRFGGGPYSTAGAAFHEVCEHEDPGLQAVDIDPIPEAAL